MNLILMWRLQLFGTKQMQTEEHEIATNIYNFCSMATETTTDVKTKIKKLELWSATSSSPHLWRGLKYLFLWKAVQKTTWMLPAVWFQCQTNFAKLSVPSGWETMIKNTLSESNTMRVHKTNFNEFLTWKLSRMNTIIPLLTNILLLVLNWMEVSIN